MRNRKNLPPLPPSQTDLATSLLGFAAALAMIGLLRRFLPDLDPMPALLLVLAAGATPPVAADLFSFRRYREPSAGLSKRRAVSWRLVVRKCFGLILTLASFAALYAVLPEYHQSLYTRYWDMLALAMCVIILTAPVYFYWCLRREDAPRDGYDELAQLALGRLRGRDWREIGRHYRNWLVKAFFLPLMLVYAMDSVHGLVNFDQPLVHFSIFYDLSDRVIMFADLLFAAIGYILTLRILNAHIRSSEPTFRGWIVAIVCYTPFWQVLLYSHFFAYDNGPGWGQWFSNIPWFFDLWGTSILLLLAIYSLSTICLGIRFSNLTYRGLITSGPYRFCKHPAYVAKNLSWWLASVPFVHQGWHALTDCALLLGVNLIYYIRARTEENHLSNYPEYVEYALAMNARSIFRPLVRFLPFLEYKVLPNPPRI